MTDITCPRCAASQLKTPIEINALSRTTRNPGDKPVYVCSPCGTDEAMQDWLQGGATPRKKWPT